MDSREKVQQMRQRLLALEPEDEASAQQLQILASLTPLLLRMMPTDSAELDGYLRTIAWGAARCRSDDAPALGIFEWDGGSWQPIDMERAAE